MEATGPVDCNVCVAVVECYSSVDATASRLLAEVIEPIKEGAVCVLAYFVSLTTVCSILDVVKVDVVQEVDIVLSVEEGHLRVSCSMRDVHI